MGKPPRAAFFLALLLGCAQAEDLSADTTSLAVGQAVPTTAASEGGAVQQPADALPLQTSLSTGFVLRSVQSNTYCLASKSVVPAAGDTLGFAPCTDQSNQVMAMYRGTFALAGNLCISDPAPIGSNLELQPCTSDPDRTWLLSADTNTLYHNIAGVSRGAMLAANSDGQNVLKSGPLDANLLVQLVVGDPPGSNGFRIYQASDPRFCLTDAEPSATVLPCGSVKVGQRWSMANHLMRADSGYCLVVASTGRPPTRTACSATQADPANKLAQWWLAEANLLSIVPYYYENAQQVGLVLSANGLVQIMGNYGQTVPSWSLGAAPYF